MRDSHYLSVSAAVPHVSKDTGLEATRQSEEAEQMSSKSRRKGARTVVGGLLVGLLTMACGAEQALEPPDFSSELSAGLPFEHPSHAEYLLSYRLPGVYGVKVRNLPYVTKPDPQGGADHVLTMDVYYPPHRFEGSARTATGRSSQAPALILTMGYPDNAPILNGNGPLKDQIPHPFWGRLAAAAGFIAVAYQTTDFDDFGRVLAFIRDNAGELHIDKGRIGMLCVSANCAPGTAYAMQNAERLRFAAFHSALMLSPDRFLEPVIDALASDLGFYTAEIDAIDQDLPMLIVRGGKDFPFIVAATDHFIEQAEAVGAQLQVIDYPDGVHGFDVLIQDEESCKVVARVVNFMTSHVGLDGQSDAYCNEQHAQ